MNQSDFNDEILRNIGVKSKNDLNGILNNFTVTDFEIDTSSESPYIDIDSLSEQLIPHPKKFSFLSVNIQNINAKFDKLLAFITYLNDNNSMFSAICIKESWLKQGQDISLFQIPGYNLINQPKVCSEHGGLITYLKREYTHNVRDWYKSSYIWEGLFINVFHEKTNKKITIGNIYRHPKNNNSNPTIENSIQQINPIIFKLSKENSHAIFTGDFNINLLEMNTRIKYQAYFDQFVTNGFYSKIVQPCRFTKRTGSVIDQTFCKLSEEIILWYTYWHFVWSSTTFYLPWYVIKSTETTKIYNKRKHDGNSLLAFYNEIEISLRNTHFPNELTTDPNVTYNILEKNILSATEKHLKHVKTKLNHYKHKKNPWISMGIINSIKFRDKMYKRQINRIIRDGKSVQWTSFWHVCGLWCRTNNGFWFVIFC